MSHSYTSERRPPCWGAKMYCSDWENGTNRITLRKRKWLLQQDLHIQVYMYVLVSYKMSCWSSHLRLRRAIRLVPFSQSLQYIFAPQHGGHCSEVYRHDVTVQWVYCMVCTCMIKGASKLLFSDFQFDIYHSYNHVEVNEDTSMTKWFCRVI